MASEAALEQLGGAIGADPDPVKDGPDLEESGIPAAYTYFGQFVDHDLTFDPASLLQRQNDPDALVDYRTPRFDLDSVYGRGPDDQPYLYDGKKFVVGEQLTGKALDTDIVGNDLQRNQNGRAIIGDPRNDENVIVSQLQGLFLRFHNKLVDSHGDLSFVEVQRLVRFHYQWMVLNDFLPQIVCPEVLAEVLPHRVKGTNVRLDPPNLLFYNPKDEPFMPLEFSVAAYRFGHSMVRPGYRLNDDIGPFPIFPFKTDLNGTALTGFDAFPLDWAIDWGRFVDLQPRPFGDGDHPENPDNPKRMQLAYKIDTSVVNPLTSLPARVTGPPANLATRNLLRGWRLRLPSGQDVARAIGVPVLEDDKIKIGKFSGEAGAIRGNVVRVGGAAFTGKCPLWAYVLAETVETELPVQTTDGEKMIKTRRLGHVGGRIVAETIVGILAHDSTSYLNQDPLFNPGQFGLKEFVKAALTP